MKRYTLLVAWAVIERINTLPKASRQRIRRRLLELEESPDTLSEFSETGADGRKLDVFVLDNWAFFFWIDFADRHVKVLHMKPADRVGRG